MNPKRRAIAVSLFTATVGLYAGIDLIRHQPLGLPPLAWSAWAGIFWMSFAMTIYGLGTLMDTINPDWEKDPFDEDS